MVKPNISPLHGAWQFPNSSSRGRQMSANCGATRVMSNIFWSQGECVFIFITGEAIFQSLHARTFCDTMSWDIWWYKDHTVKRISVWWHFQTLWNISLCLDVNCFWEIWLSDMYTQRERHTQSSKNIYRSWYKETEGTLPSLSWAKKGDVFAFHYSWHNNDDVSSIINSWYNGE